MPRPHPPEFRQRAVELARLREKPVAQIAQDLGISDSCLRNWMAQADRDEGRRDDGLTSDERAELVKLRRELRVAKLEVEILKRAAAYFATENVLPKG
jgi:transposase-like protein